MTSSFHEGGLGGWGVHLHHLLAGAGAGWGGAGHAHQQHYAKHKMVDTWDELPPPESGGGGVARYRYLQHPHSVPGAAALGQGEDVQQRGGGGGRLVGGRGRLQQLRPLQQPHAVPAGYYPKLFSIFSIVYPLLPTKMIIF